MAFNDEQIGALTAPLDPKHVKEREAPGGVKLSYIEGWLAIKEANRIFGHGQWDRRTTMCECVWHGERTTRNGKTLQAASYVARVEIVVHHSDGAMTRREGTGAGGGFGQDMGEAHESAIKEAETDAMKRALMTFGNPFGLALYDKDKAEVGAQKAPGKPERPERGAKDSSGQWTRHSVKQDMRGFLKELDACGDYDELIAFLTANKQLMQACSELAPDWWREGDPDYSDAPPFREVIERKKNALYEEARRKAEYEPAQ